MVSTHDLGVLLDMALQYDVAEETAHRTIDAVRDILERAGAWQSGPAVWYDEPDADA